MEMDYLGKPKLAGGTSGTGGGFQPGPKISRLSARGGRLLTSFTGFCAFGSAACDARQPFVAAADGHEAFEENLKAFRLDHGAERVEHRAIIFDEKHPGLFMAAVWQAPPGAGAPRRARVPLQDSDQLCAK